MILFNVNDNENETLRYENDNVHVHSTSVENFSLFTFHYSLIIMKKINWKTVIQFVITVLTAVASSFLTQSCL